MIIEVQRQRKGKLMKIGDKVKFIETDGKHAECVGRRAVIINADNKPEGKHTFIRVRWLDAKKLSLEQSEFLSSRFILDE
jgi:hypothetical protein